MGYGILGSRGPQWYGMYFFRHISYDICYDLEPHFIPNLPHNTIIANMLIYYVFKGTDYTLHVLRQL